MPGTAPSADWRKCFVGSRAAFGFNSVRQVEGNDLNLESSSEVTELGAFITGVAPLTGASPPGYPAVEPCSVPHRPELLLGVSAAVGRLSQHSSGAMSSCSSPTPATQRD